MPSDQYIETRIRLGTAIKELRLQQGLSQRGLAEKCGLIQQNIDRIEHARYSAGIDIYANILYHLGSELTILV